LRKIKPAANVSELKLAKAPAMDVLLYDIYLTGKLAENTTAALAAQRLATLFKTSPEVMAGMLTGKPHVLKRGVDKPTALKYREALQNAGVEVAFKAQTNAAPASVAAAAPTSSAPAPAQPANGLSLAPVGSDVLQASERVRPTAVVIDTSELQVLPPGPLPGIASIAIATPDISNLSLAPAGGDLLSATEKQRPPVATPAIGDFSLAPAGTLLETLHIAAAAIHSDLSGLSLAPAGTELLTTEQRAKPTPAAPATDHLKLAN
jgi:hypothetical protein